MGDSQVKSEGLFKGQVHKVRGGRVFLNFNDVEAFDTLNKDTIIEKIQKLMVDSDIKLLKSSVVSTGEKLQVGFLTTPSGHFFYSSSQKGSASIEIFIRDMDKAKKFEVNAQKMFGWKQCTTNIVLPTSDQYKLQILDQIPFKLVVLNEIKFIHREQSEFQEIKVYETRQMGRILILDDYVNITDTTMEDNYTLELPMNAKKLVKERGEVEHILIIGGGDCLILNHLASKYPQIKKISMCEIDCRVVENVMKWFNFKQWVIQEHKESGRINLTYNDGSKFVETIPNETFDAIIIDCTDPLTEDSPAKALTTVEFLTQVNRILKPYGSFSMNVTSHVFEERFTNAWKAAGFKRGDWHECDTPQYGGFTSFGYVYKQ